MVDEKNTAIALSRGAVEQGLAACAQIEGPVTSIYSWKDRIHEDAEFRIVFKSSAGNRHLLMEWLDDHHPYEVPELLAWPVAEAGAEYAAWVRNS